MNVHKKHVLKSFFFHVHGFFNNNFFKKIFIKSILLGTFITWSTGASSASLCSQFLSQGKRLSGMKVFLMAQRNIQDTGPINETATALKETLNLTRSEQNSLVQLYFQNSLLKFHLIEIFERIQSPTKNIDEILVSNIKNKIDGPIRLRSAIALGRRKSLNLDESAQNALIKVLMNDQNPVTGFPLSVALRKLEVVSENTVSSVILRSYRIIDKTNEALVIDEVASALTQINLPDWRLNSHIVFLLKNSLSATIRVIALKVLENSVLKALENDTPLSNETTF